LSGNNIGNAGAEAIAEAIKEVRVPLNLDLQLNVIGDAGGGEIAEAIKKAQIPLNLDLQYNFIADAGAGVIAEAIMVARAPLTLKLGSNNIGVNRIQTIAKAITVARVPVLIYGGNFNKVLPIDHLNYFTIESRLNPGQFLNRMEFRLNAMLKKILGFTTELTALVQDYYTTNEDAAIMVATAILAVKGVARDTRYSSINLHLLNKAYPGWFNNQTQQPRSFCSAVLELLFGDLFDFSNAPFFYNEDMNRALAHGEEEVKEEERNRTTTVSSRAAYKNDGGDSPEDGVVSSSSSAPSDSPPPGGGAINSENLHNQEAALSMDTQHIDHESMQASQLNNLEKESTVETLLKTLLAWINDLSEELQQQILSSFKIQQLMEFLETTLNPNKFIEDQLGNKPDEVFASEYQNLYGSQEYNANTTDYATAIRDYPRFASIETSGNIFSDGVLTSS
jgi:hypothetical protein